MKVILSVIHEQQVISESGKSHLGLVAQRWKIIEEHLRGLKNRAKYAHTDALQAIFTPRINDKGQRLKSIFKAQLDKQVVDIHYIAYHLNPANTAIAVTEVDGPAIRTFINRYIDGAKADKDAVRKQFYAFKRKTAEFSSEKACWADADDVELFWLEASSIAPWRVSTMLQDHC